MDFVFRRFRRFSEALDRSFERRPELARRIVRHGPFLLLAIAALVAAAAAVPPVGRGQELLYATREGSIVAMRPESGEATPVYRGGEEGFAAAPILNGGSRSLSFTVFRGSGSRLRGDLYGADLVRATRALIEVAGKGEAFTYGGYSGDRRWLLAGHYATSSPPNVAILPASGATRRSLEPDLPNTPPVLGPVWGARGSLYAWRKTGTDRLSLTAYNFFERRQATVYETDGRVGSLSYHFDANTIFFSERPRGGGLEDSRLRAIAGTGELPVYGAEGLGLYDPSIPVPELDYGMAVMWTDGERTGVGLLDPAARTFQKTGITVEEGSRYPQISYDGSYVATANAEGAEITVRRMGDGRVVRRIEGAQPPEAAPEKMRDAGIDVPPEAGWVAPPSFTWRSLEGS